MAQLPRNVGWRAMAARGYGELSPPEAEHAVLELPTNRADYVDILQDIGEYPERSPMGPRIPSDADVKELSRQRGRWRAVVLLDDERALKNAAWLFQRVYVLDPFYDAGAMLYAAWHDPFIKDDDSRRLAEHTGLLVRAAPLLNAGTVVLTPDHLPGSWTPKPGWRKPRASEDRRQVAAWAMRNALVLLYWADRLNGVVCATRNEVIAALDVLLGPRRQAVGIEFAEPIRIASAQQDREVSRAELSELWTDLRTMSRRRDRYCLEDLAFVLSGQVEAPARGSLGGWRLALGERWVPDPAMLIRRVLNGQDPEREPPLPRKRLKRRPLCMLTAP